MLHENRILRDDISEIVAMINEFDLTPGLCLTHVGRLILSHVTFMALKGRCLLCDSCRLFPYCHKMTVWQRTLLATRSAFPTLERNLHVGQQVCLSKWTKLLFFLFQVLTNGSWPFQQSLTFTLPVELEKCHQRFTTFYGTRHSGRKLNWLLNLSKGELVTNCFKNRYTLQVKCGPNK